MFDVTLMPQEEACDSQFNGNLVMTKGFISTFEPFSSLLAVTAIKKIIRERVESETGADYLQVAYYENKKFWVIDDVHCVTFLMPEEY